MKKEFSFSEDMGIQRPERPAKGREAREKSLAGKPLHNLPRGKAWNPPILDTWWFWPACIAGLFALNLGVWAWDRLMGS